MLYLQTDSSSQFLQNKQLFSVLIISDLITVISASFLHYESLNFFENEIVIDIDVLCVSTHVEDSSCQQM